MANKKTRPISREELELIIKTINTGFTTASGQRVQPNSRISTALLMEANLGLRVGDIVKLSLSSIIYEAGRYRLDIVEEKTKKSRTFTVPAEIYTFLQTYALERGIKPTAKLFDIEVRTVQNHLKLVCDHLGLSGVASHSFRKYFAMSIFNSNGFNAELVRTLLMHSTIAVTQHYLSVEPTEVTAALQKHIVLPV